MRSGLCMREHTFVASPSSEVTKSPRRLWVALNRQSSCQTEERIIKRVGKRRRLVYSTIVWMKLGKIHERLYTRHKSPDQSKATELSEISLSKHSTYTAAPISWDLIMSRHTHARNIGIKAPLHGERQEWSTVQSVSVNGNPATRKWHR